jgi:hypothetical protein
MAKIVIAGPVIEAGQSVSSAIDCTEGQPVRITMPPEWNTAALTFQISDDGEAFNNLYDLDREIRIKPAVAGSAIALPTEASAIDQSGRAKPPLPAGVHLRIRSGTAASPVIQTARREFTVTIETAVAAVQQPA